jgi:hypothetical protein
MARSQADEAEAQRKQDLAWRLYMAGASLQEIAASNDPDRDTPTRLFQSPQGAAHAIHAVKRRMSEDASPLGTDLKDEVARDIAKIDRLTRALWPQATSGEVAAVREIRQLTQLRSILMGYSKGAGEQKGDEVDPIDELAKKRDVRRAGGA